MNITQEQNMETKFELKSRDFGTALQALKLKQKVAREGWNGKGMYLVYYSPVAHGAEMLSVEGLNLSYPLLPFILMKTADEKLVPWLASQTDLLAEDWTIVN